ncbi:UvrD-helicase domain-containing protein [Bremerella sp. T1]|uniref:UvrD-helicase domain-containing protein n=1 Tax=Bremerella sp. TYQ1 TaxID=3119568 RepID=UPI001CCF1AFC|nr:UvrD-helicase domain-containing protein [Bremerella volcania]UBM37664.1 UvrD-helicase domain-containing protein [Bremerella volcania]
MTSFVPTQADEDVLKCLREKQSFAMVAGAGSGKTTSLVEALKALDRLEGRRMLRDGQKVVCITYTNRATEVIRDRLRQNPLFIVSTLHSFLWKEIGHFPKSIREALRRSIIPAQIAKQQEKDNGGNSIAARSARAKAEVLVNALEQIDTVETFYYGDDLLFSDFLQGEIGHDDLLSIASDLIRNSKPFRRIIAQRYPYWFVDEAQDTSPEIVAALNELCNENNLPIVGYFGDPMQQIYDTGMGDFTGPENFKLITKEENFRCSPQVIELLNAFRDDVQQIPAGDNASLEGSVAIMLVKMEKPELPRNRYGDDQLERAQQKLVAAIEKWEWTDNSKAKRLFLARRMIARRMGFLKLHDLFDGPYASSRANSAFEKGEHILLKPFVNVIVPLVKAHREGNSNAIMRILTSRTHAFDSSGEHSGKTIREVRKLAIDVTATLSRKFESENLGDVLRYCCEKGLIQASESLQSHLERPKREEEYDESQHGAERSDWLADAFLAMNGTEVEKYCGFLDDNTPYSTQHGVKGEEYDDVIVVFDDTEAAWTHYTFAKLLAPSSAGSPSDNQLARSRKLAYVCFSRAIKNLRIALFTLDPNAAAAELEAQGFFQKAQISILE